MSPLKALRSDLKQSSPGRILLLAWAVNWLCGLALAAVMFFSSLPLKLTWGVVSLFFAMPLAGLIRFYIRSSPPSLQTYGTSTTSNQTFEGYVQLFKAMIPWVGLGLCYV